MTSQPPLLDQTGANLPGPQFTPRPGWGGQLRQWFSKNGFLIVFRLIILCGLILIGRSLWMQLPTSNTLATPTPIKNSEESPDITLQARSGDGLTNLAARALDTYSASQPHLIRLTPAQHLYAVDALARRAGWQSLEIGQSVTFTEVDLITVIEGALQLSPAQQARWARLLR